MSRLSDLQERLNHYGFSVDTWSPGDGVTRYRFFAHTDGDYFAHEGIFTALGLAEAQVFAQGLMRGAEKAYASVGMLP